MMRKFTGMIVLFFILILSHTVYAGDSEDVSGIIENIDVNKLQLVLSDHKIYSLPEEFNFDGLKKGVKVTIFYTIVDGKRVVNDLNIIK